MLYINGLELGMPVFKALSSEVRIKIINLLVEYQKLNMNEIAEKLKLSNATVTMHVKILEEANLIKTSTAVGRHGMQKICSLYEDQIMIQLFAWHSDSSYKAEINIGHYTDYDIYPTCGLSTKNHLVGAFDDPRYFADPLRFSADILWFSKGYVEYNIPNYINSNQRFEEIQISAELGSEAPHYNNDWPSDIYLYINGIELGYWTSPGDFGGTKGQLNPDWWSLTRNQYGLLKVFKINSDGFFVDNIKVSDVKIQDLNLNYKSKIVLRFAVPEKAKNMRGLTIYGKNFGNYDQAILVKVFYKDE